MQVRLEPRDVVKVRCGLLSWLHVGLRSGGQTKFFIKVQTD